MKDKRISILRSNRISFGNDNIKNLYYTGFAKSFESFNIHNKVVGSFSKNSKYSSSFNKEHTKLNKNHRKNQKSNFSYIQDNCLIYSTQHE